MSKSAKPNKHKRFRKVKSYSKKAKQSVRKKLSDKEPSAVRGNRVAVQTAGFVVDSRTRSARRDRRWRRDCAECINYSFVF